MEVIKSDCLMQAVPSHQDLDQIENDDEEGDEEDDDDDEVEDVHLCGGCLQKFSKIDLFVQHKQGGCGKKNKKGRKSKTSHVKLESIAFEAKPASPSTPSVQEEEEEEAAVISLLAGLSSQKPVVVAAKATHGYM